MTIFDGETGSKDGPMRCLLHGFAPWPHMFRNLTENAALQERIANLGDMQRQRDRAMGMGGVPARQVSLQTIA